MGSLIFVVDGISERRDSVQRILEQEGYSVEAFATTRALDVAEQLLPALIIVAIELPDGNGMLLRDKIRQSAILAKTPVLLLADCAQKETHEVTYSNLHEYLLFPFSPLELVRAVEAMISSVRERTLSSVAADIVIDAAAMKVFVRGRQIPTTPLEFRLIDYMARHQGKVFSRDALLDAVWGELQFVTPRSVDACIRRVRRKIESDATTPRFLRTIRGIGYKLDGSAAWEAAEICGCSMCLAVRSRSKLADRSYKQQAHSSANAATYH